MRCAQPLQSCLLALAMTGLGMALARAEPAQPPECLDAAQRDHLLRLVNEWRSQSRPCGGKPRPAVPLLRWNEQLNASAQTFAAELVQRGTLSHEGLNAASLRERLRQVGYRMRLAGENLSAGPADVDELMAQWTASPQHCENLMAADFEDLGLACVRSADRYERYWVMHLAAPMWENDFPAPGESRSR